jgi:lipopolysaccharide/colanic/teichoic acid biosynthesis glycosyltransferase
MLVTDVELGERMVRWSAREDAPGPLRPAAAGFMTAGRAPNAAEFARAALVDERLVAQRSSGELAAQRALDLAVAAVACLILAVPALIVAVVVKSTSRGPVLFTHPRVGRGGRSFEVYKFRSMRDGTDAEVLDDPATRASYLDNGFKLPPDDPRITRVGRVLRRTSFDEVPQLINVLRGDMSLVGVRPVLAEELELRPVYDRELYSTMRPGMTGLWQVEGRSTVQHIDRVLMDRRYLERWSVWGDVCILARTPRALLRVSHAH